MGIGNQNHSAETTRSNYGIWLDEGPDPLDEQLEILESAGESTESNDGEPEPNGSVKEKMMMMMMMKKKKKKKKKKKGVFLEGYVEAGGEEEDLTRTKSLTDEDLEELRGCLDLGFGFSYDEIPELCNTLPALELCYSMSQRFLDDHPHKSPDSAASPAETSSPPSSGPIASWRISSPGDPPEDVKARLKFWAQAVACTVRLCS